MATQTETVNPASVPVYSDFKLDGPYGDFRDQLASEGYAVVKGAIPADRAQHYRQKALDWLRSFDASLDPSDRATWAAAKLPVQTKLNTFEAYGVVHERFMWEARLEPGVVEAFARVWGTDELLVSFDSLNVTLPGLREARAPWPHVDQAPRKRGLHCVQGIINLSPARGPSDGSLVVVPGSHRLVDAFFDSQTDPATWPWRDNRYFDDADMAWFRARGCEPLRVAAEPGDLILWDSRTVHWGGEPAADSSTVRTVIYAAYAPASMASEESLAEKRRVFAANGATTHWPHDNIRLRDLRPLLPDGTVDPRDRPGPLEKAEQTDQLLKMAGVKAY